MLMYSYTNNPSKKEFTSPMKTKSTSRLSWRSFLCAKNVTLAKNPTNASHQNNPTIGL